jgi:hypothetical protein
VPGLADAGTATWLVLYTPFAAALADTFAIADASTTQAAAWNDSTFFNAMTIGVAKWLLGLEV